MAKFLGQGLTGLATSTILSGGIVNHGSLQGYISNAARQTLGLGLSSMTDGQVRYFSKDKEIFTNQIAVQYCQQDRAILPAD